MSSVEVFLNKRVGRYEIKRELGRGAQSVVYLAHDPQLDREVAVKTLHFERNTPALAAALMSEARLVSKLRHPGVVPIFDIGEERGEPYLVFEYVPGENLQALMRRRGPLAAEEAVPLTIGILEAVQAAHDAGIIHRDLKPTNILMDVHGTPRVMDFGIALRSDDAQSATSGLSGTPAYMAPEYINERTIAPGIDIFAAGLILLELLYGRPVFRGDSARTVMERIAREKVRLPDGLKIDQALGHIALTATALDPASRYDTPSAFARALQAWLSPPEAESAPVGDGKGTLDFLLRRIRHKSDFPALSESVSAINRIAANENENIDKLSAFILRDFSLTNKLLRIVNSSHYRSAGGGSISTVSRAIVVLGFDAVRNIAITVLLFEHLQNQTNASLLKEEFLFSSFAGSLARDISRALRGRDHEQTYICALFHHLGRLLARFYFPEECDDVEAQMRSTSCTEEVAALRVFGMSFDEIGAEIARRWGFPPVIVDSMRKLSAGPVRKPATPTERAQVLSSFANEMASVLVRAPESERASAIERLGERFEQGVPLSREALDEALESAKSELAEFARIIRINLGQTVIGRKLRSHPQPEREGPGSATGTDQGTGSMPGEPGSSGEGMGGTVLDSGIAPTLETGNFNDSGVKAQDAQAVLAAGIQDISNTMVDDFKLNDILRIILETMYRGMGFRRVILCIKDARAGVMQGRFGFGPEANEVAKRFRFSLAFTPDIFHAAMKNGVDILISDIDDPKIATRIPEWFRAATTAHCFVVFPLNIKGKPVAMIYAEKANANEIEMNDKELSLLRTLRNQAVLAIKQAS